MGRVGASTLSADPALLDQLVCVVGLAQWQERRDLELTPFD
jgi:hypothetical protein